MSKIKYAISNIAWDGANDHMVYEMMGQYGFTGLEIAPTRIFPSNPYDKLEEAYNWKQNIKNKYGFSVPSMQSIWYGRKENIFCNSEDRATLIDYTKKAVDFAARIGCRNLVFGCPRNRNMPEDADRNVAFSFFREIGEYANYKGCVIGLEANPPIYNTNFLNDTLSVVKLIEEIGNKGLGLNLDMGTMIENKETLDIMERCVPYISHVHISEPGLKQIQKREMHKQVYSALNADGYDGYISVEMGKTEDISVIDSVMRYVKETFEVY